jgi:hypothetical protein
MRECNNVFVHSLFRDHCGRGAFLPSLGSDGACREHNAPSITQCYVWPLA